MSFLRNFLIVLAFSFYSVANAQVTVEAVQPPVWKEQNGEKTAVFPGEQLSLSEQLITGNDARVLFSVANQSSVELGEESIGLVPKLDPKESLFSATVNIIKGAFRYTSSKFAKNRAKDISIQLPQSTIGIRGTDLWGRVNPNDDFVVLIDGIIDITHYSGSKVTLDLPQQVYNADITGPKAVTSIDVNTLLSLATETALQEGKATLYADGAFGVVVSSYYVKDAAEEAVKKYTDQGYPAKVISDTVSEKTVHRIVFKGFRSSSAALRFRNQMKQDDIITAGWIKRF